MLPMALRTQTPSGRKILENEGVSGGNGGEAGSLFASPRQKTKTKKKLKKKINIFF